VATLITFMLPHCDFNFGSCKALPSRKLLNKEGDPRGNYCEEHAEIALKAQQEYEDRYA
jgi:hypothetical protein